MLLFGFILDSNDKRLNTQDQLYLKKNKSYNI